MSRPVVSAFTEAWWDTLPEVYRWTDESQAWTLLRYLSLLGDVAGEVEALADRVEAGHLTDPVLADARWLPWLAQFVGVRHRGQDEATLRQQIANPGFQAGSRAAIAAVLRPLLAGSQSVSVLPNDGPEGDDPWIIAAIVRESELPPGRTLVDLAAAVNTPEVCPAGYRIAVKAFTATWDQVDALGATWAPGFEGKSWTRVDVGTSGA